MINNHYFQILNPPSLHLSKSNMFTKYHMIIKRLENVSSIKYFEIIFLKQTKKIGIPKSCLKDMKFIMEFRNSQQTQGEHLFFLFLFFFFIFFFMNTRRTFNPIIGLAKIR
jgi:hypothetical protein